MPEEKDNINKVLAGFALLGLFSFLGWQAHTINNLTEKVSKLELGREWNKEQVEENRGRIRIIEQDIKDLRRFHE